MHLRSGRRISKIRAAVALAAIAAAASCHAGQLRIGLGSDSFSVDRDNTTAVYIQSPEALSFRTRVPLGATIGGLLRPSVMAKLRGAQAGLIMRNAGPDPELPFTVELFDSDLQIVARYTGQTQGAGNSPAFIPMEAVTALPLESNISGLQLTWDGDGSPDIELYSLELRSDEAAPAQDPAPSPTAAPIPEFAIPPTVSVTSPLRSRANTYRLRIEVIGAGNASEIQYQLRAPGGRKFKRWIKAPLSDGENRTKLAGPILRLNKRGVWTVRVRAKVDGTVAETSAQIRRR